VPPKPEPVKPEVKPEPPRPDPAIALKAEREKREREKAERDRKDQLARMEKERTDRKREEDARRKREQDELAQKKLDDDKRAREQQAARAEAQRKAAEAASARQKEFDRWVGGIRDKIRNRANIPDTVTGKPEVQVLIRILPGGEVLDITITKRSGNPTYDAAIERAIRSASPLPVPPPTSELFPQFRELNLNIQHER
jgi:colicin import membrane protein